MQRIRRRRRRNNTSFVFTWDGNKRVNALFGFSPILHNKYLHTFDTVPLFTLIFPKLLDSQQFGDYLSHTDYPMNSQREMIRI